MLFSRISGPCVAPVNDALKLLQALSATVNVVRSRYVWYLRQVLVIRARVCVHIKLVFR